jgi:hypothetical protein
MDANRITLVPSRGRPATASETLPEVRSDKASPPSWNHARPHARTICVIQHLHGPSRDWSLRDCAGRYTGRGQPIASRFTLGAKSLRGRRHWQGRPAKTPIGIDFLGPVFLRQHLRPRPNRPLPEHAVLSIENPHSHRRKSPTSGTAPQPEAAHSHKPLAPAVTDTYPKRQRPADRGYSGRPSKFL